MEAPMDDPRARLLAAIGGGDAVAVRALIDVDPALAMARDDAGVSVLMLARYRWDDDLVAAIRSAGAPLDVFEAAALREDGRLSELLADDPALARTWSADGFTALHYAAFFGGEAVARRLLDAGADPDAVSRNPMEVRPLHSAVAGSRASVALALIAAGADVNVTQRHGWTPLQGAAEHGLTDVVDALLAAGADPAATTDDGVDAASLAESKGHEAIAARLRAAVSD